LKYSSEWIIVFSRFFSGIAKGAQHNAEKIIIMRYTNNSHSRESVMSKLNIFLAIGYLSGPALTILFLQTQKYLSDSILKIIDPFTLPGYVQLILSVLCIILLLIFYHEDKIMSTSYVVATTDSMNGHDVDRWSLTEQDNSKSFLVAFIYLFTYFTINISYIYYFFIPLILRDVTEFIDSTLYVYRVTIALLGVMAINFIVVIFCTIISNSKRIKIFIIFSLFFQMAGYIFIILYAYKVLETLWCMLLGIGLIGFGFPISRIFINSLYKKLIQKEVAKKQLSNWISLCSIASKALCPLLLFIGIHQMIFGIIALFAIGLLLMIIFFRTILNKKF